MNHRTDQSPSARSPAGRFVIVAAVLLAAMLIGALVVAWLRGDSEPAGETAPFEDPCAVDQSVDCPTGIPVVVAPDP